MRRNKRWLLFRIGGFLDAFHAWGTFIEVEFNDRIAIAQNGGRSLTDLNSHNFSSFGETVPNFFLPFLSFPPQEKKQ